MVQQWVVRDGATLVNNYSYRPYCLKIALKMAPDPWSVTLTLELPEVLS